MRLLTALSHPPQADAELPMTFLRPATLVTAYPDLRIVARAIVGSDSVIVATGASSRGVDRLYFSNSSGRLVRRSAEIETPLGAVPEIYDFSDFKRVDGAMIPAKIVWSRPRAPVREGASRREACSSRTARPVRRRTRLSREKMWGRASGAPLPFV
jgi:hypothetical protein